MHLLQGGIELTGAKEGGKALKTECKLWEKKAIKLWNQNFSFIASAQILCLSLRFNDMVYE